MNKNSGINGSMLVFVRTAHLESCKLGLLFRVFQDFLIVSHIILDPLERPKKLF